MSTDPRGDHASLQARVAQLEQAAGRLETLIESLQDMIHQQATRFDRELGELRDRMVPAQMARDLSEDARRRGL